MKPFTVEIEIEQPRDKVVELFNNTENLFKWQTGLQSFEHLSGEPGQPGSKSKMIYINGKNTIELTETITLNQLPNEFAGLYEWSGGSNTLHTKFVELGPERTRWVSTGEYTMRSLMMKVMALLMPGMFRKQSLGFMENFKAFCEHGTDIRDATD